MPNYDYRKFICPDNAQNRQQHEDLDYAKQNGWKIRDAAKDAIDPNLLVITLSDSATDNAPSQISRSGASSPATRRTKASDPTLRLKSGKPYRVNARPDPIDFRDRMYEPTLVEVPSEWPLSHYFNVWGKTKPPVLDQGSEGACTGFGLAAVAHYLLKRRKVKPDSTKVSARMFYEMARRYDEWEGEDYSGSNARGAMKGWHKHGVCSERLWPYSANSALGTLTIERSTDALWRPLGAYLRVNHRDLVAMHSALAEVGILYATSRVHEGWQDVRGDGIIHHSSAQIGGHAYAIVGYDETGFLLQNSWGSSWGQNGFAHLSYEDWLENGTDVWVARLGAPILVSPTSVSGASPNLAQTTQISRAQLQSHTIAIGNQGRLRADGEVGNTIEDVVRLFAKNGDLERTMKNWKTKRILFYAHGGLNTERDALLRVSEYLPALLTNEVYPLAFVWKSDFWSTLGNMLKDVVERRRSEGLLDKAKDFMLDRLDDTLEIVARAPGKALWDEMKENACMTTDRSDGGGRVVLELLPEFLKRNPTTEIHIAAHSAGSILLGRFLRTFCDSGGKVTSLNLWAPACTMDFFKENYLTSLKGSKVGRFGLYTLKDPAERNDHCAHVYNKSLLYLVAHAFEAVPRIFLGNGTPLLGMEKFILAESELFGVTPDAVHRGNPSSVKLGPGADSWWIRSPNNLSAADRDASTARRHGDFDDDAATVQSTLQRIVGDSWDGTAIHFSRTNSSRGDQRRNLDHATRRRAT